MSTRGEATCALPLGVNAVAHARHFTEEKVEAWGACQEVVDTAVLLTSELVTNAVLYGFGGRELQLQARSGTLRIVVTDDAPGVPTVRHPDEDSESGLGLLVIEACADRWGVQQHDVGKSVWCEIALEAR
ncbi:MAG TPA: ATP-binding protein [Mycobacteriales bacterium]|jgi:anti-sigma regulatory factor (Ser/Thr protein kinase)|nr:ATP-binding protein [Mycobacteriales bacterium]